MVLRRACTIPGWLLAVLNVRSTINKQHKGRVYDVQVDEHPNLVIIPSLHRVECVETDLLPYVVVNIGQELIHLPCATCVGTLVAQEIDISEITTVTADMIEDEGYETNEELPEPGVSSLFITSPANIEVHRKTNLLNADVEEKYKKQLEELCDEFKDIFSTSSKDIGKTPLIKMGIDTGDSPPICQRPYNLPLKHAEWVKKGLHILEEAGVIVKSVSPWASSIVVVPKKSALGEPPKQRLFVDYRAINKLLPKVQKANSNAKGILSLVPLPKIDEIYARLQGAKYFTTLDMRMDYHHIALTKKSRAKLAFVSPLGKWEFVHCPFRLAQAPTYFQHLVNEVLAPFDFAFGYLDDILIFSLDIQTHLKHIKLVFERL